MWYIYVYVYKYVCTYKYMFIFVIWTVVLYMYNMKPVHLLHNIYTPPDGWLEEKAMGIMSANVQI